jgi:hypothetical protein
MAEGSATKTTPKIGDRMPDGTVYAGISPDTGKPMYTTPADAPLTYTFNQAKQYAETLDARGHKDWRVPTEGELNVLWENRDKCKLKGTFNETGLYPAGWHWSSSTDHFLWMNLLYAFCQRFSDGFQYIAAKYAEIPLRCVRG